jgi:phospholipase/carboxylesterase
VRTATRVDIAGLTTVITGPADARVTCVLMHGFGAPGDDLVALAGALAAPVRLVFPAAPLELGGLYGDSRAWWLLDLARLEAELRSGATADPRSEIAGGGDPDGSAGGAGGKAPRGIDRRGEVPDGLVEARDHVNRFLDALTAQLPAGGSLVLGGFSQGAMLALDVALHRAAPPAGLILMSGTLIAESVWQPRLPALAGAPVMMSHGRSDMLLPFAVAEILRDQLAAAGAAIDWQPFSGGHEIPRAVIAAADALLRRLAG